MVLGGVLLKIVAYKHIIIESYIRHTGNQWKCDRGDRDGDDVPNLYFTISLRQRATPESAFKLTCYGSMLFFCIIVKNVRNCTTNFIA